MTLVDPKLHVFEALKNGHVGDVALLAIRQYFDSRPTNLIECQQHHVECAGEERTAFLCVFIKIEQKKVAKLHVFEAPKNGHVGDVRVRV